MSVWGLSCHAKGWGHHPARRCNRQLPSGQVFELRPPPILPPRTPRQGQAARDGGGVTEPLTKSRGWWPSSLRLSAAPSKVLSPFLQ